ncbi:transcription antitermination factor NusB [Patescibacteria group bacterium]
MSSSRHLARTIAMQSLYEWDFRDVDLKEITRYNIDQFGRGIEGTDFTHRLVEGVLKNIKKIDDLITKSAPEWPIDQIAKIDKAVIRLGIFELLFSDEVPPKVAINEAVEIAKIFGSESSSKFVNGVLGTVYREHEKEIEKKHKGNHKGNKEDEKELKEGEEIKIS